MLSDEDQDDHLDAKLLPKICLVGIIEVLDLSVKVSQGLLNLDSSMSEFSFGGSWQDSPLEMTLEDLPSEQWYSSC